MNGENKYSISYSWTQPYNISINSFYQKTSTEDELKRLEMIDRWVDAMETYPDADELIKRIFKY